MFSFVYHFVVFVLLVEVWEFENTLDQNLILPRLLSMMPN